MLVNNSIEEVPGIPFLSFSNVNVEFVELEKLFQRSYTTAEALPIISRVELIYKKEFAQVAFDENSETFVIYVVALKAIKGRIMAIHPSRVI